MCGRYALMSSVDLLVELFSLAQAPALLSGFAPRYNIAPTQEAPVVRAGGPGGDRRLDLLRWGLVPSWAKDPDVGARMINARSETAATKPSFRTALRRRRCLVPADGFYEWRKLGPRTKQPYFIHMKDRHPFALAGLWEHWCPADAPDAEPLETFTILTTEPNALTRELHDRMPVIVAPSDFDRWLDPDEQDPAHLAPLLRPFAAGTMDAFPVGRHVNSPRHDDPACVEPVPAEPSPADPEPPAGGLFG